MPLLGVVKAQLQSLWSSLYGSIATRMPSHNSQEHR